MTSSHDDDIMNCYSILAICCYKKRSIGPLIRNAVAFNFQHLAVIGNDHNFSTHGAHGSQSKIRISCFYTWQEFFNFIHTLNSNHSSSTAYDNCASANDKITIYAISTYLTESSIPLSQISFKQSITATDSDNANQLHCSNRSVKVFIGGCCNGIPLEILSCQLPRNTITHTRNGVETGLNFVHIDLPEPQSDPRHRSLRNCTCIGHIDPLSSPFQIGNNSSTVTSVDASATDTDNTTHTHMKATIFGKGTIQNSSEQQDGYTEEVDEEEGETQISRHINLAYECKIGIVLFRYASQIGMKNQTFDGGKYTIDKTCNYKDFGKNHRNDLKSLTTTGNPSITSDNENKDNFVYMDSIDSLFSSAPSDDY